MKKIGDEMGESDICSDGGQCQRGGGCDHPRDGQCLSRTAKTGKTSYFQML
ncbi:MAG: hypothetical protein NTX45_17130 [Proteobacteria bacterium]|nr:hypothetical protein [Pseudomonadota bacterium]